MPVWFATRPSYNREHSMHMYVLLDQPMPAQEAAEHVRRLLRTKPGAPPGQWCEILVRACRLPAGLDAARLDPATGAELEESPGVQLRSILQLRGTCDRLRVRRCPIRVPRMAQDTRGSFAAGPGAETCLDRAPSPLEAITAAAEARAERYELAEAAGGERPRFGSVGPLPWDEPREIAQLLRSGSVDPGRRNALARAVGHYAHAAGLDEHQVLEAFDAITFQGATWAELRGWRTDCMRSYERGAELLRNPAATEAPMPTPDKLREIATAALEQLPDEVRSHLEADAAKIPHRALRRAFLRLVGYTLARCRQGQPDVPTLTLRALVGTPRWCAPAIDRAVRLGWLRIEREADRLEHRCRRFAPGPQAGAPAPDPPSGCIIEFPMQHWSIVEFPLVHMSFLGTHNDPKGERSDRSTPHTRSDRSTPHTRSDRSTPHTRSDRSTPHTRSDRSTPHTRSDRSTPHTRSDRSTPHTRSDRSTPHTRSDRSTPHTRSDRSTPHTRSDRSTPHTRSDRGTPHTRSDRGTPHTRPTGVLPTHGPTGVLPTHGPTGVLPHTVRQGYSPHTVRQGKCRRHACRGQGDRGPPSAARTTAATAYRRRRVDWYCARNARRRHQA